MPYSLLFASLTGSRESVRQSTTNSTPVINGIGQTTIMFSSVNHLAKIEPLNRDWILLRGGPRRIRAARNNRMILQQNQRAR